MALCWLHEWIKYDILHILGTIWKIVNFTCYFRKSCLAFFVTNQKEPAAELSRKRDGHIVTWRDHETTHAVVEAEAGVGLYVGTSAWHESGFSGHSDVNIFGLLYAIYAHFFHDSTYRISCNNLGHTCHLTLIINILTHTNSSSLPVTDGPPLRWDDRMLIWDRRLNYLINILPIEIWPIGFISPFWMTNHTAVKRWQICHHLVICVTKIEKTWD